VRLLFDEQLAEELCALLRDAFPESQHVRLLGCGGASDEKIWQLAIEHRCVLVTKDEDFHRLSILRGAPPKVVWIRLGNCTTAEIATLLLEHRSDIERFVGQEELTFLELDREP
jgi:predicted nuclease of predicted toxin-antitoxin system